jgi:ADP-ribose pyrophosphatase YjhB (NUDIX family)
MSNPRIRAVSLCAVMNGDRVLVRRHVDHELQQVFFRPPGGTIEYGEHSRDAARREVQEEIGADVANLRLLGCVENIFAHNGDIGHEIVFIYRADFIDLSLYGRERIDGQEADGQDFVACWLPLAAFTPEQPLYPTALLGLLHSERSGPVS